MSPAEDYGKHAQHSWHAACDDTRRMPQNPTHYCLERRVQLQEDANILTAVKHAMHHLQWPHAGRGFSTQPR
jgi:hypothetical protein